jgi:chromate reductase
MTSPPSTAQRDIAVFVGSLRKESFSRKLAHALQALAPSELNLELIEIGDLPMYNQDLESALPAEWARLRARVPRADGVLFVTPEYNRSLPAVLKNAIDVGSRPMSDNVWNGKPGGVLSISPGAMGGFGAQQHLRQALVAVNVLAMAQPAAYIGGASALYDQAGALTNPSTREFVAKFAQAFADWVARFGAPLKDR